MWRASASLSPNPAQSHDPGICRGPSRNATAPRDSSSITTTDDRRFTAIITSNILYRRSYAASGKLDTKTGSKPCVLRRSGRLIHLRSMCFEDVDSHNTLLSYTMSPTALIEALNMPTSDSRQHQRTILVSGGVRSSGIAATFRSHEHLQPPFCSLDCHRYCSCE